jgi:hypothetical protein
VVLLGDSGGLAGGAGGGDHLDVGAEIQGGG